MLNEENYKEVINAYTTEKWKPLLELIPEIEDASSFGRVAGGQEIEEGVMQFHYMISSPVVDLFRQLVYELPVMVVFDWGRWKEGNRMLNDESFDFDTVDIPTKCKLITSIVRADRFSEGYLVSAFESGVILRILKSIERGL